MPGAAWTVVDRARTDTMFRFNKDGVVEISGDRYDFSGSNLPHLRPFMESRGADPNAVQPFASLDDTHIGPRLGAPQWQSLARLISTGSPRCAT